MYQENARKLLDFIDRSPSCFHVIENMKKELVAAGFCELKECDQWQLAAGGAYYVTRNGSAIIAFRVPASGQCKGYQILASHSDSPVFKVKENPEVDAEGAYVKLNVEKYGGMILSTWLDRPLSVAGRILVRSGSNGRGSRLETRLVNIDRDLVLIPNLAIHMNREVNDGYKYSLKTDMMPLLGALPASGFDSNTDSDSNSGSNSPDSPDSRPAKPSLTALLAAEAGVAGGDIVATDLYLYNRQKGTVWGADSEFISSAKLDDLECAYGSLMGILGADGGSEKVAVHCVLDNEEVGSGTKQGAAGTFLQDTLKRICSCLGGSEEDYLRAVASSFLISADNAHAVHPNRGDMADSVNRPKMNGGIVIKFSGNQKYSSDAVSAAVLKMLCEKADVPVQIYTNRSDIAGGSTLGNISTSQVSVNSVDIGLPQLAMHSAYETAGVRDITHLMEMAKTFFSSTLETDGCGGYQWK